MYVEVYFVVGHCTKYALTKYIVIDVIGAGPFSLLFYNIITEIQDSVRNPLSESDSSKNKIACCIQSDITPNNYGLRLCRR